MDQLQKKYIITLVWIYSLTMYFVYIVNVSINIYDPGTGFYNLFVRYDLPAVILLLVTSLAGIYFAYLNIDGFEEKVLASISEKYWYLILFIFIMLSFGAYYIYQHYPLSMDEYAQYFQAKVFSYGKICGKYPPGLLPWLLPFDRFFIVSSKTGHIISDYWPGYSFLLTPFMKIRLPWLLNPILATVTIIIFVYYLKNIFNDKNAIAWGIIFTVSSAVFMVNSISYYSMTAHLLLNLLFAICLLKITYKRLVLAGIFGSIALTLHNPVPHIVFAIPWIIWILAKKKRITYILCLAAGYVPLSILLGLGWLWLGISIPNGSDQSFNVKYYFQIFNTSQKSINTRAYTLISNNIINIFKKAFHLPNSNIFATRIIGWLKIFAWSLPGLPILAILGVRFTKRHTHLKLWLFSAILTLFVYVFVPFSQGLGWGFRYFYSAWLALPLIATAFITSNEIRKPKLWKRYIMIVSLISFIFVNSLRYYQVHQYIGEHLAQLPKYNDNKNYIYIMDIDKGYYIQDMVQNDPFLNESIIILRSMGENDDLEMMKERYPNAIMVKKTSYYTVWEVP